MDQTAQGPALVATESPRALLAYALALELEASERYAELAEQMQTHNNPEVVELFQKLARIEKLHADRVLEQAEKLDLPDISTSACRWESPEGPETTDLGEAHYLMTPHHALRFALHNEQRAYDFFAKVAAEATDQSVAQLASEMATEEQEHVALMQAWLAKYPQPDDHWSHDPDSPAGLD